MSKRSIAKRAKAQIREHARMAELLLPPTPEHCPKYPARYFESYRSKFFEACRNSRHRHCPKTAVHNRGRDNLYCSCPCHLPKLSKHKKRQMWLQLKKETAKAERKLSTRTPRDPNAPRAVVGTKGQAKVFRYLRAPDEKIPAGIMFIVHDAIRHLHQGTVAEVATAACTLGGLEKVTSQDPTAQTSIMLHRMLKAGVVEVV